MKEVTKTDLMRLSARISDQGGISGPSSAADGDVAVFDGTTGKVIKDSGAKLSDYLKRDQGEITDFNNVLTAGQYYFGNTASNDFTQNQHDNNIILVGTVSYGEPIIKDDGTVIPNPNSIFAYSYCTENSDPNNPNQNPTFQ